MGIKQAQEGVAYLAYLPEPVGVMSPCRDSVGVTLSVWPLLLRQWGDLLFRRSFNLGDGAAEAFDGFFASDELGDVKHVGAFAFTYNREAECVHDIAHVVAFVGDPSENHRFGGCA